MSYQSVIHEAACGVLIRSGPTDWQVVQQRSGAASIELAGLYLITELPGDTHARVRVRIVRENTGESVLAWQDAKVCRAVDAGDADWAKRLLDAAASGVSFVGSTDAGAGAVLGHDAASQRRLVSGAWRIVLADVPAGGLYRIETMLECPGQSASGFATRGDIVCHLGVGDVFLIAGQSNAAGRAKDMINDPPELGVHMYRNNGSWTLASHPMNETTGSVYPLHYEKHNPGHSPYLAFAKMIRQETGFPVGLVTSALGGMPLSCWDTEEDGRLYRNMLQVSRDAAGGRLRGVLWYQGCTDGFEKRGEDYFARFCRIVDALRTDLRDPELPFFTVQLNRCTMQADPELDRNWGLVRDAQRRAAEELAGVYVVPASDCMLYDFVHNSAAGNLVLGERLGRVALAVLYGRDVSWRAPSIRKAEWSGENLISLLFDPVDNWFNLFDLPPERAPITVEDEEGVVPLAEWGEEGSRIVVRLGRKVRGACKVHGVWQMNPPGPTPADCTRLPILSFYGIEVEGRPM